MSAFNRTLNETLTFSSFLNAGGNLGFGAIAYHPIGFFDSLGFETRQRVGNSVARGLSTQPRLSHLFVPEGIVTPLPTTDEFPSGSGSGQGTSSVSPGGEEQGAALGVNFPRPVSETITFNSTVDLDGNFIRSISETIDFINRVGSSVGIFFRDDLSTLVTSNPEVRLLSRVRDTGEIAVSQRPTTGPFKVLRYVPGSTPGSPNTVNLGSIPSTVGSQGFILDDSPHGVLLRGTWQVKLVVFDSQASGQIKLHVSLYAVKATTSSVIQSLKIGITQSTSAFTPSLTPTQYTLNWTQDEAGEVFIADDEFIYVEVLVEEISHPGSTALTRLRLSDFADTFYSQMRFPGVTDEPTYSLAPADETLTFSDTAARVVGFNRPISESIVLSDALTKSSGLTRIISEIMTITDAQVLGVKNNLSETIAFAETVDRLCVLYRSFTESVLVTATLSFHASTTNGLIENMPITATVSGFIVRPPRRPLTDGLNKRPVDPYKAVRKRNI